MPLRNRVTPFGEIAALATRGTLMGNRGCLHDGSRNVTKSSARPAWVTCRLQWKGIRRTMMSAGKYTELFFLDEATALAAGHRPCNDCRSERLRAFQQAWSIAVEQTAGGVTLVSRIDPVLQRDRSSGAGIQRTFAALLSDLPDGTFLQRSNEAGVARLKWCGRLHRWTPEGYTDPQKWDPAEAVTVLTPACTVRVIRTGYVPAVHGTAKGNGTE